MTKILKLERCTITFNKREWSRIKAIRARVRLDPMPHDTVRIKPLSKRERIKD